MKKPRPKKAPKPRNIAAKALAKGQFQPKVEDDPKAYKRREKHRPDYAGSRAATDDDGVD